LLGESDYATGDRYKRDSKRFRPYNRHGWRGNEKISL
jgi:hypothetical protein